jgi:NADH:ubiquinone oxidoreductase subunit K
MELRHWLMVVGALFLVFGLFGLALRKNVQVLQA